MNLPYTASTPRPLLAIAAAPAANTANGAAHITIIVTFSIT